MTTAIPLQDFIQFGIAPKTPVTARALRLMRRRDREVTRPRNRKTSDERARVYQLWLNRILDDHYLDWLPDLEAYVTLDIARRHPMKPSAGVYLHKKEALWHRDSHYERFVSEGSSTRVAATKANEALPVEFRAKEASTIKPEAKRRGKARSVARDGLLSLALETSKNSMLSLAAKFRSDAESQPPETAACYRRAADLWEQDAANLQPPFAIEAPVGSIRRREGWKYMADDMQFPPSTWALLREFAEAREHGQFIRRQVAAALERCSH